MSRETPVHEWEANLLAVWEGGAGVTNAERAVRFAGLLHPEASASDIADRSIGAIDADVLRLRRHLFGDRLNCAATCPSCAADLEVPLSVSELLEAEAQFEDRESFLETSGYKLQFRLPRPSDVLRLTVSTVPSERYQAEFIAQCISDLTLPEGAEADANLPQAVIDQLADEMQRLDPLAVVWLSMHCEECDAAWKSVFDITSVLWAEINHWARLLLVDVHLLAKTYGWAERDILGMSPFRRARYLEMVGT